MKAIKIFIDTSVLRKYACLSGGHFQSLNEICRAKLAVVMVHHIVKNEFITAEREIKIKEYETAINQLKSLSSRLVDKITRTSLDKAISEINVLQNAIYQSTKRQFAEWVDNVGVEVLALTLEDSVESWKAYFEGTAPFASLKNRNDLPDSVIFQSLLKQVEKSAVVHFICGDKNLLKATSSVESLTRWSSLADFIESPQGQALLVEANALANIEQYKLSIREYQDETNELSHVVTNDIGEMIVYKKIGPWDEDDESVPTISSFYDPSVELDLTDIFYYGSGDFGIPFVVRIEVAAYYYVFKSDWYAWAEEKMVGVTVSDHNKHYFEAESSFNIVVRGYVSMSVDVQMMNFNEFGDFVDTSSIKIEELESILLDE